MGNTAERSLIGKVRTYLGLATLATEGIVSEAHLIIKLVNAREGQVRRSGEKISDVTVISDGRVFKPNNGEWGGLPEVTPGPKDEVYVQANGELVPFSCLKSTREQQDVFVAPKTSFIRNIMKYVDDLRFYQENY